MVGPMSMFKSVSNLVTAIVLFACLVLGAALMMAGGDPEKIPTAQPLVVSKRPETQAATESAASGTAGALAREMRTAAPKPIVTAEKMAYSPAADTSVQMLKALQENAEAAPANLDNQASKPAATTTLQQPEQTQVQPNQAVLSENASDDTPRSYKVQQGDSLSGIAQKMLGAGNRWPEIARANNITEHDWILPGQELIIPAKAERIESANERQEK